MDKILYFGYVVLTSFRHRKKLLLYSRYFSRKYNKGTSYFLRQAYLYYFKYSMHPLDYFYFNVYSNAGFHPKEYASTLFMYKFHKQLNDKRYTKYFFNKMLFHEKFRHLMGHDFISLQDVKLVDLKQWIIKHNPEYLIIKKLKSVGGFGVKKINVEFVKNEVFVDYKPLSAKFTYLKKFDLMEEFVYQHDLVNKINPSCLNTVRVVTILDKSNNVHILGAVVRFGVNNDVDNFHSGGIAVKINIETGRLEGNGFRLAPSDNEFFEIHPVSKIKFDGYQLPYWSKLLETVKKACLVIPQAKTIGWDVAIKQEGISLIEGNHDWDKIIIEKALKKGIRKKLEEFL